MNNTLWAYIVRQQYITWVIGLVTVGTASESYLQNISSKENLLKIHRMPQLKKMFSFVICQWCNTLVLDSVMVLNIGVPIRYHVCLYAIIILIQNHCLYCFGKYMLETNDSKKEGKYWKYPETSPMYLHACCYLSDVGRQRLEIICLFPLLWFCIHPTLKSVWIK